MITGTKAGLRRAMVSDVAAGAVAKKLLQSAGIKIVANVTEMCVIEVRTRLF
jgi:chorismate synthase